MSEWYLLFFENQVSVAIVREKMGKIKKIGQNEVFLYNTPTFPKIGDKMFPIWDCSSVGRAGPF